MRRRAQGSFYPWPLRHETVLRKPMIASLASGRPPSASPPPSPSCKGGSSSIGSSPETPPTTEGSNLARTQSIDSASSLAGCVVVPVVPKQGLSPALRLTGWSGLCVQAPHIDGGGLLQGFLSGPYLQLRSKGTKRGSWSKALSTRQRASRWS